MLDHEIRAFAPDENTYSDAQLLEAVYKVVRVYVKIGNQLFNTNLPMPRVGFNLCETEPTWGGAAIGGHTLLINMVLYRDNVKEVLNQTVVHEIAHLFQRWMFDLKGVSTQAHGAEWQEIMKKFGKDPFKFHQMDVTKAKQWHKEFKKKKKQEEKALAKALADDE